MKDSVNPFVKHAAWQYHRYKNMLNEVPEYVIQELKTRINEEFSKIPVPVKFVAKEMDDFDEVKSLLKKEGVLYISSLNNESDLFPGETNLRFRAWHDWLHIILNAPFDLHGEYNCFLSHSENCSPLAKKVLYSEVVLQTCYKLFFGEFPPIQKVVLVDIEDPIVYNSFKTY